MRVMTDVVTILGFCNKRIHENLPKSYRHVSTVRLAIAVNEIYEQ
jgi:hypothetical protein